MVVAQKGTGDILVQNRDAPMARRHLIREFLHVVLIRSCLQLRLTARVTGTLGRGDADRRTQMGEPVACTTRLGPNLHSSNVAHRKRARRRRRRVGKPAEERRA